MMSFNKILRPFVSLLFIFCVSSCSESRQLLRDEASPESLISVDSTIDVSSEEVRTIAPSSVEAEGKLERSGNKYILKITFSFTGPKPHAWQIQWFADRDDGRDELIYMGHVKIDGTTQFEARSSELDANRIYRFNLIALVMGDDPSGHHITGDATYKKIRVDLRGVER